MTPLLLTLLLAAAPSPLSTNGERSGFTETGRYAEVEALCAAFPRAYPGKVRCERFGTSPEGRPLLVLVASADGTLTPAAARAKRRPVVFFQGGIHAGEIEGKDAGFLLLRHLLEGKVAPGVLGKVTAVFVPVFNVDGHERFGPNQRPNQTGPTHTGWRVTAQNLNLNRDYVKADAPEMQAMLRLWSAWLPVLSLDLHATDGAKFQPDVALNIEPRLSGPAPLRQLGQAYQDALFPPLKEKGHQPLEFYPSFRRHDDPASGFAIGVAPPRFSQGYWSRRNRLGVLVETHSWRTYRERVQTTYDVLALSLELAAREGMAWLKTVEGADAADRAGESEEVVLAFKPGPTAPLDFPGYAYSVSESPALGRKVISYDESKPQVWRVPYASTVVPERSIAPPRGGYVVPAAHAAWVKEKLALHGLSWQVLKQEKKAHPVERFRAESWRFADTSFEGHQPLSLTGRWEEAREDLPAGSLFVPAAQPGRELLVHLFEPGAPDSLLSWGFFNPHFEQKEYVEDYVLDVFARELLAKDAQVRARFERLLKEDAAFAADPQARADFFYRLHPAYDVRFGVYPVVRVDAAP